MLFWVVDKDNFYQAVIAPNGMFTVARKVSGKIVPTAPVGVAAVGRRQDWDRMRRTRCA